MRTKATAPATPAPELTEIGTKPLPPSLRALEDDIARMCALLLLLEEALFARMQECSTRMEHASGGLLALCRAESVRLRRRYYAAWEELRVRDGWPPSTRKPEDDDGADL